jgi:hypothetical protein
VESSEDKRRNVRRAVALDVVIMVGKRAISARSRDISLAGMFIETNAALAYGTPLRLVMTLPSLPEPVIIPAIVRWSGAEGVGVQFRELRERETWVLHQLVRP